MQRQSHLSRAGNDNNHGRCQWANNEPGGQTNRPCAPHPLVPFHCIEPEPQGNKKRALNQQLPDKRTAGSEPNSRVRTHLRFKCQAQHTSAFIYNAPWSAAFYASFQFVTKLARHSKLVGQMWRKRAQPVLSTESRSERPCTQKNPSQERTKLGREGF